MGGQGRVLTAVLWFGVASALMPLGAAVGQSDSQNDFEELEERINLSDSPGVSDEHDMAVSGNDVYVVYRDVNPPTFEGEIKLRKSEDRGQHFGDPESISDTDRPVSEPHIAVQTERVYIVWLETQSGPLETTILFRRSENGAESFDDPVTIDVEGAIVTNLKIAADGCDVYVAWSQSPSVRFSASHNCGRSFDEPTVLSNQQIGITQMIARGTNVFIIGDNEASDPTPEVFFIRSTNEGRSFESIVNLSQSSGEASLNPRMAVEGNKVYVVWEKCDDLDETNVCDVLFRRSTNNGDSFGPRVTLSDSEGLARAPDVAAEGVRVYVAWQDNSPGNFDIFLQVSFDEGQRFRRDPQNLSETPESSVAVRISAEKQFLRVAWVEATPGLLGLPEIFYRASDDSGKSSSFGPVLNLSETPEGASILPLVLTSIDGKNGYVSWVDVDEQGTSDVFFRSTEVKD